MREALFYKKIKDFGVECLLCPHHCVIKEAKTGICGSRANQGGRLCSLNYGKVASVSMDPIEKKPLYHFHPGEMIFSVGSTGCNLSCSFCQNWQISKDVSAPTREWSPRDIVEEAKRKGSFGIAFTYNEPFVWYEFVRETAILGRACGLKNVLVTNGFVEREPLREILGLIDAMNIDLKSIREAFYHRVCSGRLEPVLATIKEASRSCHVELTNLIIPTLNDSEEDLKDLVDWVSDNLGEEVPLHFSRYFPCYQMTISATPRQTLERAAVIARKKLKYVYLGNI